MTDKEQASRIREELRIVGGTRGEMDETGMRIRRFKAFCKRNGMTYAGAFSALMRIGMDTLAATMETTREGRGWT